MVMDSELRINHFESFQLRIETPKAQRVEVNLKRRIVRSRPKLSDPKNRWCEVVDFG
jgi:hypothetical protein